MKPLVDRVAAAFAELVGARPTIGVVAISGGPDSVALAHLALQLSQQGVFRKVVLAHLNHQLRGDDSDADEVFVHSLAEHWGLPVVSERIDVAGRAVGRNLEQTAREIRYAWLADVARAETADWVATGHTADDQAETVLHHVLRGSGLAGLAGIAARMSLAAEVVLIRPLLKLARAEVHAYLNERNLSSRVDSSNADTSLTRNRLRHVVLPLVRETVNPAVVDALTRLAEQARETQAEIDDIGGRHLSALEKPRAGDMVILGRPELAALPDFWIREVFRAVWKREGWPMGEMTSSDWRILPRLVFGDPPAHDFPGPVHVRVQRHVVQLSFPGSAWDRTTGRLRLP